VIEVDWSSTSIAHLCELIPGVSSPGPRRSRFVSDEPLEAFRAFVAMSIVASAVGSQPPNS
jgi:D-aminopeptidase